LTKIALSDPIQPFELFATANTVGLGDTSGLDPWNPADQSGSDGSLVNCHDAKPSAHDARQTLLIAKVKSYAATKEGRRRRE